MTDDDADSGQYTDETYRVQCPECENGRVVDSEFIAEELAKTHNYEYGHTADYQSQDTDTDHSEEQS